MRSRAGAAMVAAARDIKALLLKQMLQQQSRVCSRIGEAILHKTQQRQASFRRNVIVAAANSVGSRQERKSFRDVLLMLSKEWSNAHKNPHEILR